MASRFIPSRSTLDKAQHAAVVSPSEALRILGGEGTGKSTVIAHRAVEFARRAREFGCDAQVYVLASSAEGARTLFRTIREIQSGESLSGAIHVTTVPLLAAWCLRGAKSAEEYSILRPEESQVLVSEVLTDLGFKDLSRDPVPIWREIHARRMRGKSRKDSLHPRSFPLDAADLQAVEEAYDAALRRARALDPPGVLKEALDLVTDPETPGFPFDALLVDDLQDLTPRELDLMERAFPGPAPDRARDTGSITVTVHQGLRVMDAFGADSSRPFDFGETVAETTLNTSYVPAAMAQVSKAVAPETGSFSASAEAEGKAAGAVQVATAASGAREAVQIARHIRNQVDENAWTPGDVVVCSGQPGIREELDEALRAEGVPVRVPGRPFHGEAAPEDVLAYLYVLANPHDDVHLRQIINRPSRGIGRKTLARISAYAADHDLSVWDAIAHADEEKALTTRARRVLMAFREMLLPLVRSLHNPDATPGDVPDIARDLVQETGYLTRVTRGQTREQIQKEEDIERLIRQLSPTGSESTAEGESETGRGTARHALQVFLDQMALGGLDARDMDSAYDDAVTLCSLRDLRGMRSPVIVIAGLEEGQCPAEWAIRRSSLLNDERRALARAMSHADDTLILSWAQSRGSGRDEEPTMRSRFLDPLFDSETPVPPVERIMLNRPGGRTDFRASLRAEQATSTPKAPPTDDDIDQISGGQRVRHPKLGDGTVQEVTTDNGRRIARVRFDERGTKTLQLKYAPLEVLG